MSLQSKTTSEEKPSKAPAPSVSGGKGELQDASASTSQRLHQPGPPQPAEKLPSEASETEAAETAPTSRSRISRLLDRTSTPAFLVSLILHTLAFLMLALWTVTRQLGNGERVDLQVISIRQDEPADLVEMVLAAGDEPPPPSPVEDVNPDPPMTASTSATALSELLIVEAPKPADAAQGSLERLLNASSISLSASFASTGVEGRRPERREQIALARGGTLESEKAVEDALDWLAEHQLPTGAWSLIHDGGRCNGQCRHNGSKDRFDTAATGLSLLAFLGAGYTHKDGKHRETVRKGVYFLLQVMEETPEGGSFMYQSDRGMYNHGIATFALCEAYQLTQDRDLQKPAQQAIDFIASAQHYRRGWGYLPKQPGDLTLSGWQVMALKSAFAAGLDVPPATILQIDPFLDSQQSDSGVFYGYGAPGKSPTCTAIGLLLRMFRGMPHSDPRVLEAATYFRKVGRSNGDAYFNYYVTLFLFHVGQPFWDEWNPTIRDHLVKTQAQQGHEAGSWYFENVYGKEGGRVYTTAMCAMTLEIYYRFSPLYQQSDVPFEL